MIKLHRDPHPGTTTKKKPASSSASASSSTSAAAKLLLRCRGRSGAANKDESIELLSALRNSQLDLRASCHAGRGGTHDVKGKEPRRGGGELLSTGIGKHDYDWLLTPPVSPLWSPATSAAAGDRVSAAAPSRLERAFSASHARSNSRQLPLTRRENGSPAASRLARSSFATTSQPSVAHAPGIVFSGRPSSHARTWSYASASASSINTVSNASVTSTRLGSSSATSRACRPQQGARNQGVVGVEIQTLVHGADERSPDTSTARRRWHVIPEVNHRGVSSTGIDKTWRQRRGTFGARKAERREVNDNDAVSVSRAATA
ncbi:hypothetical protein GUJ93_ZPchr0018g11334 [Zizania palustris]|uniref:Uncharacterized protein n=1 Tax=Zizania palustris TaxID=103762 RepID=A0A8J5TED8_ZIZPA|nr:hypothetical protein GUJ93_ZPchr0018g11334 [Zizania palustris]